MKKNILALSLLAVVAAGFTACSSDDLSSESVIKSSTTSETVFDKWLYKNYVVPYNIQIQWRYEDNESDMAYYDVPADSAQSVELAHIIKYTCVEAYTEVAGIDFTRRYFPKLFSFLGEFEYDNSGTMKLGTAEGGKKIRLLGINHLDQYKNNRSALDELYLKTTSVRLLQRVMLTTPGVLTHTEQALRSVVSLQLIHRRKSVKTLLKW